MPNIGSLLNSKLEPRTAKLVYAVGELAHAEGIPAYAVGGVIRDLVLGLPIKDVDISVVGDGPAFAKKVAENLSGKVVALSQFGTASIDFGWARCDIVTARSETYERPGVLPKVNPGSIEDDMRRRDFTVNAMATSIVPESWGALLDPTGGFSDCARRQLRVICDSSFADDPTRALRALRYAARLGFTITDATRDLMEKDIHHMGSVSSARVGAEFRKILAEPKRGEILAEAESIGALAAMDMLIRIGFVSLNLLKETPHGLPETYYLACISASLNREEAEALARRIDAPMECREALLSGPRYKSVAYLLEQENLSPSEVVSILEDIPVEGLEVQLRIALPNIQGRWIREYLARYRHIRPELNGNDLIAMGVPPGPDFGQMLRELREARLDGKVSSRAEEAEFVDRRSRSGNISTRTGSVTGL